MKTAATRKRPVPPGKVSTSMLLNVDKWEEMKIRAVRRKIHLRDLLGEAVDFYLLKHPEKK